MRLPLLTILQIAFLAASSAAQDATATATFNAHVKIVASCTSTATALDFGTLPGLITGTETTTSTLTVTCSRGAAFVTGAAPKNILKVKLAQGICQVSFDYKPKATEQATIGPLTCR
jgi:hypothetical protein